jgi:serine/threonine-protein kinase
VPDLSPGDVFAGCRIEAVLGRGGMGVVYRALQIDLRRPVALKVIAGDRATDSDFRERFEREARMAAAIDHPNVVPVHGAGEEDGELYLVMRYVPGSDLHGLIKRDGHLDGTRAAAVVSQIASALDAAHAAGLVHRDVKPGNVLLTGSGEAEHAYLSDFGLMRPFDPDNPLTESGQWIGTIDFASPEQLQGEPVDARSDVYSLGCVLYAALTGTPPFPRGTVPATLLAHMHEPPPRPSTTGAPREFDRVIARALAKDPDDRYPSAGDLGRAALAAARGEAVTESERSVAVGPAAPGAEEDVTRATAAPTRALTRVKPATARREEPRPAAKPRRGKRTRLPFIIAAGLAAAAAGIGAGFIFGDTGDTSQRAAALPLTAGEVRDLAGSFAGAYQDEDAAALRRVLATDVVRVLPTGVARGRPAVVTEYERQFATNTTRGYELVDLETSGGPTGRASAHYRVTRAQGAPIEGKIVLAAVRDRSGQARIGLIAVTPSS